MTKNRKYNNREHEKQFDDLMVAVAAELGLQVACVHKIYACPRCRHPLAILSVTQSLKINFTYPPIAPTIAYKLRVPHHQVCLYPPRNLIFVKTADGHFLSATPLDFFRKTLPELIPRTCKACGYTPPLEFADHDCDVLLHWHGCGSNPLQFESLHRQFAPRHWSAIDLDAVLYRGRDIFAIAEGQVVNRSNGETKRTIIVQKIATLLGVPALLITIFADRNLVEVRNLSKGKSVTVFNNPKSVAEAIRQVTYNEKQNVYKNNQRAN